MATYVDHDQSIRIAITAPGEGWTVSIPCDWTIAQIERYLAELREFAS